MKKDGNIKDLEEYKKQIKTNTLIHSASLLFAIPVIISACFSSISLFSSLALILFVPINIYCLMLQRYNYIRINKVINKFNNRNNIEIKEKEHIKKEQINTINKNYINNNVLEYDTNINIETNSKKLIRKI